MKEIWTGFWYYLGLITSYIFNLIFVRTKVFYEDETRQNRRLKGKAIIISNHKNPLDGYVIAHKYFTRRIYYIIADFFKGRRRIIVPFIRVSGAVLVDRDAYSFDFFEESKRLLNKNKLLLIFPEGRFSFDYEPIRFVYSYIALAIQSGAKIVPIASDCNYGLFKRVHIMIGGSIDLSGYGSFGNLTKDKLKEINEEVYQRFIQLYFLLKKRVYTKYRNKYVFIFPKPGDIIRISMSSYYHYGIFISRGEVIQFGHPVNAANRDIVVNSVTLDEFCGGRIPEVKELSKKAMRNRRETEDIIKYARSCLGQRGYNASTNNCHDFANRVIFK